MLIEGASVLYRPRSTASVPSDDLLHAKLVMYFITHLLSY